MRHINSPQSTASYVFECVMAIIYIAMAYVLLFTSIFNQAIQVSAIRTSLGILFGFYGIFRIYRAVRKYFIRNKD